MPNLSFFTEYWYLFVVAVVSGGLLLWPMVKGGVQSGGGVSPAQAVNMINRERAVVVDISDAPEFAAGHVVNAKNLPLATLETAKGLPSNKALPIVVVCASGARAPKAVAILVKLGYANARAMSGGLAAWRGANLPVEKSAEGKLEIGRKAV
ncbi:MAG: sulfurtransferase [Rhizobacter sp.]|nr:sulfurtransferase [Rhizobacter sp.]